MKFPRSIERTLSALRSNKNFTRLLKNGAALLTSNTAVTLLQFLQVITLTRYLLPEGYGILTLVTTFVLLVNQFIDVRVAEMTIKFGSAYVVSKDKTRLSALLKISYGIDFVTGVIAFAVVMAIASWSAQWLWQDGRLALLVRLYAWTLLISTLDNTNSAILRIFNRFQAISVYSTGMAMLEFTAVTLAAAFGTGVKGVLIALLIKDSLSGIINIFLAGQTLGQEMGGWQGFWQAPIAILQEKYREIAQFVLHTNFMAYFRMMNTKVDVLILGFFRPPSEVGVYKFARQLATTIGRVSDPFFAAILPDLSQLWSQKRFPEFRQLLRQITFTMGLVMALISGIVILGRNIFILLVAGQAFLVAGPQVIICILAFAVGSVFFWTWPAALSMQRPQFGTAVGLLLIPIQLGLAWLLVPRWGGLGNAWVLLTTYLLGQGLMAWLILRRLTQEQRLYPSTAVSPL